MDEEQYDKIRHHRQAKAVKEMSGLCNNCKRPKLHHTAVEANKCKKIMNSPYYGNVEPEKREKMDLTKRQEKL